MSIVNQEEYNEQLAKQPPLSRLDAGIWLALALVSFLGCGILFYLTIKAAHGIPELDPIAVAVQPNISIIWFFPAFILLLSSSLTAPVQIANRYALFGLKGAVYEGSTRADILGYPLFMDLTDAPEHVAKKVRKERSSLATLGIVLMVSLCVLPLGFYGRNVLLPDGRLISYSGRNTIKAEYTPEDIDRFRLEISKPHSGRYDSQLHYEVDFMVRFHDGKYYTFRGEEIDADDKQYYQQLLELKNIYGMDVFLAEDKDLLPTLVSDHKYDPATAALVYKLFSSP